MNCENGMIPMSFVCDGYKDCYDGSYEKNSLDNTVPHGLSNIVPRDPPDNAIDSPIVTHAPEDPAPEIAAEPEGLKFVCAIGTKIRAAYVCDGYNDCGDGSDEINCVLRPDQFQCADGQITRLAFKCDGGDDCKDGSDEVDCQHLVFNCADGSKKMKLGFFCDNLFNCDDESDEVNCTVEDDEFLCGNKLRVKKEQICDGEKNCNDGSDEKDCPLLPTQFQCEDGGRVKIQYQCDYDEDCKDGSDEKGCPVFACTNGKKIRPALRCDFDEDCDDGSDEVGCGCEVNQFRCPDHQCIPLEKKCDGKRDCISDAFDEEHCSKELEALFQVGGKKFGEFFQMFLDHLLAK